AVRRRRHLRAPPAPVRGEQPLPRAARRLRPCRQRHLRRRAPRRDRRASGPSVVRRQPVPPRVQVAADAPGAALPRLRRRCSVARSLASDPARRRLTELVDLFLELAAIASPPGEERAVTDVVQRYLRDLGLVPDEDAFGNVYARIEPTAEGPPLFFCAHL